MDAEINQALANQHFEIEMQLLLDAIYLKYHCDFRGYAGASLKRRLATAMIRFGCETLSQLQDKVLHDATVFPALMDYLTVQVSEMFRDPSYFLSLREKVIPLLRTYPSLKIWVAGCSSGEEVYSLAILLREEGNLTLAVGSKYFLHEQRFLWGDFAAAAVLSGLPITLVFLLAQRWIVSGLTAGGVKG